MQNNADFTRYAVITKKNPREIVMLRGDGCKWRRCRFCDYHLDFDTNAADNFAFNRKELDRVTGIYGKLEVINSGSVVDLDEETLNYIQEICLRKGIDEVHFECHWMHRAELPALRAYFWAEGITLKIKIGVESFDADFREGYLDKGITAVNPAEIADGYDECCLLQGLRGQTEESMVRDIETGLAHFERVCVNIMRPNSTPIHPDSAVILTFVERVLPRYEDNERVDILLENTDFGVGGIRDAQ